MGIIGGRKRWLVNEGGGKWKRTKVRHRVVGALVFQFGGQSDISTHLAALAVFPVPFER